MGLKIDQWSGHQFGINHGPRWLINVSINDQSSFPSSRRLTNPSIPISSLEFSRIQNVLKLYESHFVSVFAWSCLIYLFENTWYISSKFFLISSSFSKRAHSIRDKKTTHNCSMILGDRNRDMLRQLSLSRACRRWIISTSHALAVGFWHIPFTGTPFPCASISFAVGCPSLVATPLQCICPVQGLTTPQEFVASTSRLESISIQ